MIDPVGVTARWVAGARARESARPDRLFDDPFAAALAGAEGLAFANLPGRPDNPFLVLRTCFFDDLLLDATGAVDLRQVVLVGAGMDARAFRLPWPAGVHFYELDQPAVLALKESILGELGAQARCARTTLGLDLTQPWGTPLASAGFDPQAPSAWLIEGVLPYLDAAAVDRLLAQVAALAAPGSRMGADLCNPELMHASRMQGRAEAMAARGSPWIFASDDPEGLFARHGWAATITQPGEPGADFGRWPFPVLPLALPGVPRFFFIQAQRM